MAQQPPPMGVIPQEMMHGQPPTPQPVNYYSDASTTNDLTGGLPINLDSLRDGPPGSKPFYPYSTLIRYAIKGSPNQKLLLEDIYYAIESRFPYFRTAPPGWKNSVRHNLSLNPCFEKVPRPLTDRGKGSYWTVNDNVDPRTGVHRIRKKKGKGASKGSPPLDSQDIDYHPGADQQSTFDPSNQFVPPPPQMGAPGEPGPSRPAAPPFPPPYPFDPTFPPPPMIIFRPDEQIEVDEHGQVNWHAQWRKELVNLQQATEEQEKAGADQEWYRHMLIRVRTAMMAPPMNVGPTGEPIPPPPHMAGQPPNPGEVPMQVPVQQEQ
ncbi:hypothetical protein DICSQDRAFT_61352 [Dichomitus squalens LYAD-421 SS1]|uniref:Fork-head domain-containing protein n=1 Tax=Dichomitus squalens (strain LYAD-421) TaxID=732165 RepID=R7SYJ1_DICSQ|nr:uncharacterized protein DICSQDRAFT_61352 [Dichomitus squalens LYAD-421 SS1]EJF61146.1 hypothetical protein DICSQDRAFT_61352 [Dichomitus squalens LYAD-421 SS1]